jgi:hypothetical protein
MALNDNYAGITDLNTAKQSVVREDGITVESNMNFYYGDHWQMSAGWAGPIPSATDGDYTAVATEIERGFVSKNSIKEIVDRGVNGVLGRDPKFNFSAPEGMDKRKSKKLLAEAEEVLKKWMKEKDFKKYVQKALRHAFLSGSSTLRVFIPAGFVQEGVVSVNEQDPLSVVYLDAPTPLSADIIVDDATREKTGVFIGSAVDESGKEREIAEVNYLLPLQNEDGKRYTEITIIPERGTAQSAQLDLNGQLMMFELELPRMVTEQIRSLQMLQNLNLTMMERNAVLGGFLERIILNGQLPGHYEDDGQGGTQFVRDDFAVGAGTVNAINGVPTLDENGNTTGYTQASINYRDPVSVKTFLDAQTAAYRGILEESQQLHALISGDAITSGDSRRQALAAFMSSLRIPKQVVESAMEWLGGVILSFAGTLTGDPGKFADVIVKAEAKLDYGAISAGEIDLLERQVRIGIISIQTARERIGIEDTDEEQRRVESELKFKNSVDASFQSNDLLDSTTDNRDKMDVVEE